MRSLRFWLYSRNTASPWWFKFTPCGSVIRSFRVLIFFYERLNSSCQSLERTQFLRFVFVSLPLFPVDEFFDESIEAQRLDLIRTLIKPPPGDERPNFCFGSQSCMTPIPNTHMEHFRHNHFLIPCLDLM